MLIVDYRIAPSVKPAMSQEQRIGSALLTACALLALAMPAVEPHNPAAWVLALVLGAPTLLIVWYGVRSAYREAWEDHCYRTRERYRKEQAERVAQSFARNKI